jgi:alpha-1,2-mannosyltransferase
MPVNGETTIPARLRLAMGASAGSFVFVFALIEIVGIVGNHGIGDDFAHTVYQPAHAVLHGLEPYGNPRIPGPLAGSVYPPSAFLPFAWLGLIGHDAAVAIWSLLMAAAACATLRVLNVRDFRCYALWLFTPMMLSTIVIGNATTLVILLVAIVWRWRDVPWIAATALVAAIATKLFVAPLVVWLLVTKRYRAAALTILGVPAVILAAWAVIGFRGLGRYGAILSANDHIFSRSGPYLQGLLLQLHASPSLALAAGAAAAATLLVASCFAGDLGCFALAACAAIILSPVAWIGYTGLLVVPLAVLWPTWSRPWLLLLGSYISWYYSPLPYRSPALSICTLALLAAVASAVVRADRADRRASRSPTPAGAHAHLRVGRLFARLSS